MGEGGLIGTWVFVGAGAGLRRKKWLDRAPPLSLRSAVSGPALRPRGGCRPWRRQQGALGLRAQVSGQDAYAAAPSLTGRALAHGHEGRARAPLAPHLWCRVVPLLTLSRPPHLSSPPVPSIKEQQAPTARGDLGWPLWTTEGEGDSGCALRDLPASRRSPHSPHPAGWRDVTWVRALTAAVY